MKITRPQYVCVCIVLLLALVECQELVSRTPTPFLVGSPITLACQVGRLEMTPTFPLQWYRQGNNTRITASMEFTVPSEFTVTVYSSVYTFTVQASDHGAVIKCVAAYPSSETVSFFTLCVSMGPTDVRIRGKNNILTCQRESYTCTVDGATCSWPDVNWQFPEGLNGSQAIEKTIYNNTKTINIHKVTNVLTIMAPVGPVSWMMSCKVNHTDTRTAKETWITVTPTKGPEDVCEVTPATTSQDVATTTSSGIFQGISIVSSTTTIGSLIGAAMGFLAITSLVCYACKRRTPHADGRRRSVCTPATPRDPPKASNTEATEGEPDSSADDEPALEESSVDDTTYNAGNLFWTK